MGEPEVLQREWAQLGARLCSLHLDQWNHSHTAHMINCTNCQSHGMGVRCAWLSGFNFILTGIIPDFTRTAGVGTTPAAICNWETNYAQIMKQSCVAIFYSTLWCNVYDYRCFLCSFLLLFTAKIIIITKNKNKSGGGWVGVFGKNIIYK